jgi:plastocyanin
MAYFSNAQIIINEIMYNPPESGTDYLEYIELLNAGNSPVNLLDYSIKDAVVMTFPDTTIAAHGFIVICVDSLKLDSVFGIKALQWQGGALRNTDEVITLLDANVNFIDSVHYYSSWNATTNGNGASLELCLPTADNSKEEYWRPSETNTGIQINGKLIFATPGIMNSSSCAEHTILVSDFKFTPANIDIFTGEQIEWKNQGGLHNINGTQSTYPSNPESFGNGAPSSSNWSYIHKFDVAGIYQYQCDVHGSSGMKGTVTVRTKDINYPNASIGLITSTNGNGELDSLNKRFTLEGLVYGVNLRPTGLQFTLIDALNDGIAVFLSAGNLGYSVNEGDLIQVKGLITQFNGLAEIVPDTIKKISAGNILVNATVVNNLTENTESQLVEMKNMEIVDPNAWTNNPLGFTVKITDGIGTWDMRIDNDVNIHGTTAPSGKFDVKGLGTQFDASSPYFEGYQLMPRYLADIKLITDVKNETKNTVQISPNPVSDILKITTDIQFNLIQIFNLQGDLLLNQNFSNVVLLNIPSGVYYLKLSGVTKSQVLKLIKL